MKTWTYLRCLVSITKSLNIRIRYVEEKDEEEN